MSGYKPYPKYRDSGVEWLGEVPDHWGLKRMRFMVAMNPTKQEVSEFDRESTVDFLPMDAVGEDGSLRLDASRKISEVETGYTYFANGDVTYAKITPCFENGKGAFMQGLNLGFGFGTTEFTVMRPRTGQMDGAYLWLVTKSNEFRKLGEASMYGAGGQKRVPDDFARELYWVQPPLTEQKSIAAFLERETGKLDLLIREQKELIALLQEKRQALISNAVTKGLNPKAKMKDSGVEWLGEVPEHWNVKRLKQVAQVRGGVAKGRDMTGLETILVPYLRVANVQDGYLNLEEVSEIEIGVDEKARYELKDGDVLMNEGGDFDKLGRGCVWDGQISPCVHQNHVFSVRPFAITSKWLAAFTASTPAKFYFMSVAKQSTNLASMSSSNLQELVVCCPSDREQGEIVRFISSETKKLDDLIQEAEETIDLMHEHRSSLISEAVTGKIDVRDLV